MNVYQVVSGLKKESGGPSYTVRKLCEGLAKLGVNVELNTLGDIEEEPPGLKIVAHRHALIEKLGFSPDMKRHLLRSIKSGDVIHTHGLWMMPNVYPGAVARKTGAKLVMSPRGMLCKWSLGQRKYRKKIFGLLAQKGVIFKVDCMHVTAESEYEDVRNFGFSGPIAVIPNGVDIPEERSCGRGDGYIKKIIFLGRIHKKKGIEKLLEVWDRINNLHEDWVLEICGPGDGSYVKNIRSSIESMEGGRVSYRPPVYGEEKSRYYQSADLFVLPTESENFGVAVAEALAHGVPVIVTKSAPWPGIEMNECGWWVDNSVDAIEYAMHQAMGLPIRTLKEMGKSGRAWMVKDFGWEGICERMKGTYEWLLSGKEKPGWIVVD